MSPGDVEVRVRDRFIKSGTPAVTIDYQMRRTAEGWKVYDIAVDGVSLVLNYRDAFDHEIRRTGIDGLIAVLQEKNRARGGRPNDAPIFVLGKPEGDFRGQA